MWEQRLANISAIENLLLESLRWSRDHKGETYKHAAPCEWCLQQGLLQSLAVLKHSTPGELRNEYTEQVESEKKQRRRVVKKPVKRRVVVRRK